MSGLLPIASTAETVRGMAALLRGQRWRVIGAILTLAAGVGVAMTGPWIVGLMVDAIVARAGHFWWLVGLLTAAGTVGAVIGWRGRILLAGIVQQAVRTVRESAFTAAVRQPSGRLEAAGSGDLVGRLSGDVRAVGAVVSTALPAFLTALLTTVLSLTGMGLLDLRLALAALVAVPLQLLALRLFLRRSGPVYRSHRAAQAVRAQDLLETVRGADTIRSLGTQAQRLAQLDRSSTRAITFELRATHLRNLFYGRLNVGEFLGLAAVLVTGFFLVRSGAVTLGAASAAALYYLGLFNPIGTLLGTVDDLQDAGASLARLFGLASLSTPETIDAPQRHGGLEFRDVSFGYRPETADLDSVSVSIPAGQRVGVVGASGAGKSTLAKLAAGLLVPDTGHLRWGDRPVVGRQVAMVSQEPHVFAGTVREDLTLFSRPQGPSVADVVTRYGADWIRDLPDGLDTRVGAGGQQLTPGQAQHLALLRLALTDAPIVILDEATAEAGTDDADLLDRTAELITRGRTAVVIAHRLSQIASADRILVLEGGRIVEDGTHDELLALGQQYARLHRANSRAG